MRSAKKVEMESVKCGEDRVDLCPRKRRPLDRKFSVAEKTIVSRNGVRSSVSLFERFGGLLIRIRSARAESISLISIDDRRDRESRVSRRGKETGGGEKVEFGRDSSATTLSH